jgi:hypothetical protein
LHTHHDQWNTIIKGQGYLLINFDESKRYFKIFGLQLIVVKSKISKFWRVSPLSNLRFQNFGESRHYKNLGIEHFGESQMGSGLI